MLANGEDPDDMLQNGRNSSELTLFDNNDPRYEISNNLAF